MSHSPLPNKSLFLVSLSGNLFELYEFSIYAYFASYFGFLFFVPTSDDVDLLKAFLIFTLSYIVRPLGALFFAILSKYSNKLSLTISLLLMSSATAFLGLLPTYETGGRISLVLLIILRLIQGLSAGGEFPINASYMYEVSQYDKSNSIFCSAINVSSLIGVLLGSLVTKIITTMFTQQEITQGAWRIPFLLGIPLTFFIIWARRYMQDIKPERNKRKNLIRGFFYENIKNITKGLILTAFLQVSFYILYIWMPSYLNNFLNFNSQTRVQTYNIISLILLGCFALSAGYCAQFIKTKKLIIFSVVSTLILLFPTYKLLFWQQNHCLLLASVIFAICIGSIDGLIIKTLGDLFYSEDRVLGISFCFTIAACFLGGTAPLLCSYLIAYYNFISFPFCYIILWSLLALPVALSL